MTSGKLAGIVENGAEDGPHPHRTLHQGGGTHGGVRAVRNIRLEGLAEDFDRKRVGETAGFHSHHHRRHLHPSGIVARQIDLVRGDPIGFGKFRVPEYRPGARLDVGKETRVCCDSLNQNTVPGLGAVFRSRCTEIRGGVAGRRAIVDDQVVCRGIGIKHHRLDARVQMATRRLVCQRPYFGKRMKRFAGMRVADGKPETGDDWKDGFQSEKARIEASCPCKLKARWRFSWRAPG